METQLANQLTHFEQQAKAQGQAADECNDKINDAHRQRSEADVQWKALNEQLNKLISRCKKLSEQRNRIIHAVKVDGSYGELEPTMQEQLLLRKAQYSGQHSIIEQSVLASLTQLTVEYPVSQAEPFMLHLTSCHQETADIAVSCTTLYHQAVTFFRRRARQDIQRATQPREMLQELSRAAEKAQAMLADTEASFQMRREELADALLRRINDEKRAINKLSAELTGIGFGQVSCVRLEVRAVKHFQETLSALKSGSYGMDDLFSSAGSVTDALAGLYRKITQHEIDGERLLDHRNYLDVKTLIRRHGAEQFEMLDGSNLSTGERIGSGLAVLIAVLKHWGRSSHGGKEPFAIPLVMDEVSRLDAASQATVHELAVRTGCQMLVAAPESLGQITGIGYQLVRTIISDNTKGDGRSVPRHQVKITGIRDAQQLPFNVDDYLATEEQS